MLLNFDAEFCGLRSPSTKLGFSAANTQWNRLEMYAVDPHHCKQSLLHFVWQLAIETTPSILSSASCNLIQPPKTACIFFFLHCRRQAPVLQACFATRNNATRKISVHFSYTLLSLFISPLLLLLFSSSLSLLLF